MMGGIICSLCHDREITTEKPRSGACSNGNDKIDVEKKNGGLIKAKSSIVGIN